EGDPVSIVEIDPAGNELVTPWRIGIPRVTAAKRSLFPGEEQSVTGENFQPGEAVTAVMRSDPVEIGKATADKDGRAVFTWKVAADTALGEHAAEVTGPLSGMAKASFEVAAKPVPPPPVLPFTGSSGIVGTLGAATGLLAGGWLLLLAARRRRNAE
ncbi:MAG: hypothetical protein LBL01_03420, partial [Bifidobacteriaceae bacterium]|nr:hypothetical protein [Bifidobacteriaceae bacterium]